MSTADSPAAPARATAARPLAWWLVPTGLLALTAIGILWALPRPMPLCPAIYPAPPECSVGGDAGAVIPFLVLIVVVYAAIVTCAVLLPAPRRPVVLGLLTGALGLVLLIGVAATLNAAGAPTPF